MKLRIAGLGLALIAGLAGSAAAHGVWLAERYGQTLLVYGHGAADDAYDPTKIKMVRAFDQSGGELAVGVVPRERHAALELPEEAALVAVHFDNGYWTKRADGSWVNEPRSAVPDAQQAGHYVKHLLAVLKPGASIAPQPDLALQILPLVDPLQLAADATLPVRVLFDGAPLEGAKVIADYVNRADDPPLLTDAKGEAAVLVRNQGLNVIAVAHDVATPGDPDADKIGHFATLSFTLADKGD
jgi:uncharacterized GH25 family protein